MTHIESEVTNYCDEGSSRPVIRAPTELTADHLVPADRGVAKRAPRRDTRLPTSRRTYRTPSYAIRHRCGLSAVRPSRLERADCSSDGLVGGARHWMGDGRPTRDVVQPTRADHPAGLQNPPVGGDPRLSPSSTRNSERRAKRATRIPRSPPSPYGGTRRRVVGTSRHFTGLDNGSNSNGFRSTYSRDYFVCCEVLAEFILVLR